MIARLLLTGMLLGLSSPALAGTISMFSTPYPDSIVIDVTIDDTGEVPGCGWLAITRGGSDVHYIERQPGATINRRFVDTNVEPSTLYCYRMDLRQIPAPVPCFTGTFCDAFYCFYDVQTCANTGPDPAFIGHGLLTSEGVDYNETHGILLPCGGGYPIGLHALPPDAQQYVDSGTPVKVYGTFFCCWAQGMWLLVAESVVPQSCVLAVEETSWGAVKALYR